MVFQFQKHHALEEYLPLDMVFLLASYAEIDAVVFSNCEL